MDTSNGKIEGKNHYLKIDSNDEKGTFKRSLCARKKRMGCSATARLRFLPDQHGMEDIPTTVRSGSRQGIRQKRKERVRPIFQTTFTPFAKKMSSRKKPPGRMDAIGSNSTVRHPQPRKTSRNSWNITKSRPNESNARAADT